MHARSDTQQATLRHQLRDLIEQLSHVDFSPQALEQAFEANRADIGNRFRPLQMRARYASTFERLFNFKGNARKFLGTAQTPASLPVGFQHIRCVWRALNRLGYRLGPNLSDGGPDAWIVALTRAQAAVACGLDDPASVTAPTISLIPHPQWRFVQRPEIAARLLDRLEEVGAVALFGMPGIGKSVLARQVAARAEERGWPAIVCDAGSRLRLSEGITQATRPTAAHYVGIWADLLRELARRPRTHLPHAMRQRFDGTLGAVLQRWTSGARDLQPGERRLLDALAAYPSPAKVADAVAARAVDLRHPLLVDDLCAVMRLISPETLVVLDNVRDIACAASACRALFARRVDESPPPLRLLLTSQRAADDLAFLVSPEAARASTAIVNFQDVIFARRVVAGWSVGSENDLTKADADARIDLFRAVRIARDPALAADIDKVIARVGGHALALAALSSVWRFDGHKKGFWRRALAALDTAPAELLHLEVERDPDQTIERRHTDVLLALRLAWGLLDDGQCGWEATRERFLDLGISDPSRPISEAVFNEFWKRAPRGSDGSRLGPAVAPKASPLRRLQAASFVQAAEGEAGSFVLHDLHRILIEHELGGSHGLAARHQDLLRAFGWFDADRSLFVDEHAQFAVENGRTVLWPDLGPLADEAEINDVGRYLRDALPHHLAGAAPGAAETQLIALTTCYRFLQARLDDAGEVAAAAEDVGNVASLTVALEAVAVPSLLLLHQAVRLAAAGLGEHRRQLAGQLLARLPADHAAPFDVLRASAAGHGLRPAFTPRFPFLVSADSHLRARLPASRGLNRAEWIVAPPTTPRVLTCSGTDVVLWDPQLGVIDRSFPHGGDIRHVRWIPEAPEGPAILGHSGAGKRIALWDARSGRARLQIEADESLNEARWIADAPGGPAILSWSVMEARSICLWDARTGDLRLRVEHPLVEGSLPSFARGVSWLAATPDGPAILGWSAASRSICIWDAQTGEVQVAIESPDSVNGATYIAFAADGPGVLGWSARDGVRLWSATTGQPQRVWRPPSNEPVQNSDYAASYMTGAQWISKGPRGPAVLWWSRFDRRAHLWDVASSETLVELRHGGEVRDALWVDTPRSEPVIFSRTRYGLHLWDARTGKEHGCIQDESEALAAQWLPDGVAGQPTVLSQWSDRTIRLHDGSLQREHARFKPQDGASDMAWVSDAPGGPAILTSSSSSSGGVGLWHPLAQRVASVRGPRHDALVWGVAWLPPLADGPTEVMSWSADRTVRLCDAELGVERLILPHDAGVTHAAWIATGQARPAIVSCADDRTIRLWADADGEQLSRVIVPEKAPFEDLTWISGADGLPLILAWQFHGGIVSWQPWTDCTVTLVRHENVCGARLVDDVLGAPAIFSWASDSGVLRCWDAATGDERGRFTAPERIAGIAWVPHASQGPAVLGWAENRVVLWDAATGEPRLEVGHDELVVGASWVADAWGEPGILSSSYDHTIRLWDLNGRERVRLEAIQGAPSASWIAGLPSGPAILSWSILDRPILLWDLASKRVCDTIHHGDEVSGALWIHDPVRPAILSWSRDRTVRLTTIGEAARSARFDLDADAVAVAANTSYRTGLAILVGCADGRVGILDVDD